MNKIVTVSLVLVIIVCAFVIYRQHQRIVFLDKQVTELVTESFSHTEPIILEDL